MKTIRRIQNILLVERDKKVSVILKDFGITDYSNFRRDFLKVTGKSPKKWREEKLRSVFGVGFSRIILYFCELLLKINKK